MSLNFNLANVKPWIGSPNSRAAQLCEPSKVPPVVAPFTIQWELYLGSLVAQLTRVGVELNFENAKNVVLDTVKSVYIDNLRNNVPVYVLFPDTGFEVACQPNAAAWFPVYTNGKKAIVIGDVFTLNDRSAVTNVFLSNMFVPPYISNDLPRSLTLYRASPVIQRGNTIYNSLYAPPALGDQISSTNLLDLNNLNAQRPLWGSPHASGFIYVTTIVANISNCVDNSAAGLYGQSVIESTGISGTLFTMDYLSQPITGGPNYVYQFGVAQPLLNLYGMQLKLDATQTWRLRVNSTVFAGNMQLYSTYTVSDAA